jgi:hypothetical protein
MHASGSMNVNPAKRCLSPNPATAVYSAHTATSLARQYSRTSPVVRIQHNQSAASILEAALISQSFLTIAAKGKLTH